MLRENRLVWSGWGDSNELGQSHTIIKDPIGVREVSLDTKRLRLFFLSLLWRSAATDRYEFAEVSLPPIDLESLRKAILGLEDPPLNFYSVQLTQLSTKGVVHNQTPYRDVLNVPNLENPEAGPLKRPIFRFSMDGLIAHFFRDRPTVDYVEQIGNLIVGAAPTVLITTVTFAGSLQAREMATVLSQYHPHR